MPEAEVIFTLEIKPGIRYYNCSDSRLLNRFHPTEGVLRYEENRLGCIDAFFCILGLYVVFRSSQTDGSRKGGHGSI